jgi:uncharacterized Tic20 family protein
MAASDAPAQHVDMSTPTYSLRVSEAEREPVVELLKAAYVDGRLAHAEFESRLDRALTARTSGELWPLTADLVRHPGAGRPARERRTGRDRLVAAGAHASSVIPVVPLPLLFVAMLATRSTYVRRHVVEALNFQLSLLIVVVLTFGVGAVLYAVVWVIALTGAVVALVGQEIRYPLILRPFT